MKRKRLITSLSLLCMLCFHANANATRMDTVRLAVLEFLRVTEYGSYDNYYRHGREFDIHIKDHVSGISLTDAEEVQTGIYVFTTYTPHQYDHFLLISNDHFSIINMRQPTYLCLEMFTYFLKNQPQYTSDQVLAYMNVFVRTDRANRKYAPTTWLISVSPTVDDIYVYVRDVYTGDTFSRDKLDYYYRILVPKRHRINYMYLELLETWTTDTRIARRLRITPQMLGIKRNPDSIHLVEWLSPTSVKLLLNGEERTLDLDSLFED